MRHLCAQTLNLKPDLAWQVALVTYAQSMGLGLRHRSLTHMTLARPDGSEVQLVETRIWGQIALLLYTALFRAEP